MAGFRETAELVLGGKYQPNGDHYQYVALDSLGEPMAQTRGAEAMGDAYFGLYLWAMGQGRPRTAAEIRTMLAEAGFSESRQVPTRQPIIASLIVACA